MEELNQTTKHLRSEQQESLIIYIWRNWHDIFFLNFLCYDLFACNTLLIFIKYLWLF